MGITFNLSGQRASLAGETPLALTVSRKIPSPHHLTSGVLLEQTDSL